MSIEGKIYVVIAGNKRFKPYVEYAVKSSAIAGYTTKVYDLGDLGYGMPFKGKVGNERNAKIPCKPEIIQHAMKTIAPGDWIAWCDADAVIKKRFDEIKGMYDIGVTMRQPKASPHDMPINAGIVFCCKTPKMEAFLEEWVRRCQEADSDQAVLNSLIPLTQKDYNKMVYNKEPEVAVRVWKCWDYNNFYFKKNQSHCKFIHYKSKFRWRHPTGEIIE